MNDHLANAMTILLDSGSGILDGSTFYLHTARKDNLSNYHIGWKMPSHLRSKKRFKSGLSDTSSDPC